MASKPTDKPAHLFVTNPINGKPINVLPLLEFMDSGYGHQPGPRGVVSILQDIHDLMSITMTDDQDWAVAELSANLNRLIQLRKTFERMAETHP